jgi:hypothetical protein
MRQVKVFLSAEELGADLAASLRVERPELLAETPERMVMKGRSWCR